MKKIIFSFIIFGSAFLRADARLGLELLPKGRPFRLTFSDPRELRMGLSFQGNSQINAAIGNYFSLFGIRSSETEPERVPSVFHMGLEGAGYFTMRQAEKRFPLETADGLIGVYFEGTSGPWQGQLRLTHISAHLADGSSGTPIAYSREFAVLKGAYVPNEDIQLYGGIHYLVNTVPIVDPWTLQLGGSYFLPFSYPLLPFLGVDLKWKEEASANPSFQFMFGLALNNPPKAFESFRLYYSYFTGTDPRGQFFNQATTVHSVGIDMQI